VDEMRDEGLSVGLIKPRLWRPFPFKDLRDAVAGADLVIVCDRAMSLGGAAGPVLAEVRSALYPLATKPQVVGYTVGLGGRDVQPQAFKDMVAHALKEAKQGPSDEFYLVGVRG
ncbi:MAG: pyruvate ferredoxin oxidoreductase, partial [Deltaproteobacteria bacterium]|nr:pyruvate ferredoxin oxidoreductase [Deltaproteobacteria bacterium]